MNDKKIVILIIILIVILSAMFLIINLFPKENIKKNTQTTTSAVNEKNTSSVLKDYQIDERSEKIIIEGEEEEITVRTYVSRLDFKVDYDIERFDPFIINSKTMSFIFKENSSIYVNIENLDKDTYFEKYEKFTNGELPIISENQECEFTYKFLRANDTYLLITKSIIVGSEYAEGVGVRLDNIINSLYISKF